MDLSLSGNTDLVVKMLLKPMEKISIVDGGAFQRTNV